MKPHKHAELIKQWADGAEIQCLGIKGHWVDIDTPYWNEHCSYRIKPTSVVRWLWASKDGALSPELLTEWEAELLIHYPIKLEWSRTEFSE
jgi:hypothetical protein